MLKKPDTATFDFRRERGAARRIAKLRAFFCGLLGFGTGALLVTGLVNGRFEKMRRIGTIVYVDDPFGFMVVAAGLTLTVCMFAWLTLHFWDESRR